MSSALPNKRVHSLLLLYLYSLFFPEYSQQPTPGLVTLQRDECGEPIDPSTLFCYRMDHFGKRALVPNLLCRYRVQPTRLSCTTPSSSTERVTTIADSDHKAVKKDRSVQFQSSIFISLLVPVFQIVLEYCNLA